MRLPAPPEAQRQRKLDRMTRREPGVREEELLDTGLDCLIARGYLAQREAFSQRATADRLRAAHDQLARAIGCKRPRGTGAPAVVVRTDAAGRIIGPSEAAARWLNVPSERLVGIRLLHFVTRRDTHAFRAMVRALRYDAAPRRAAVQIRPRRARPELVDATVKSVAPDTFEWTLRPLGSSARSFSKVEAAPAPRGGPRA